MPTALHSTLCALAMTLVACAHDPPRTRAPAAAPRPAAAIAAEPLAPKDASEKPRAVPITAIERHLIAGEREPHLPPHVRDAFYAAGRRRPAFIFKMCLDDHGRPTEIAQVGRGNGRLTHDVVDTTETSPELLAHFHRALGVWRFEPYLENGRPVPLCTAIMFRYHIDPAPRRP